MLFRSIIGAPHKAYKALRFPPSVQLVDPWGAFRGLDGLSPAR